MVYHALWLGSVVWADGDVAKSPTPASDVLQVRARLTLASWGDVLSPSVHRLPLTGQVVQGGPWSGARLTAESVVEVQHLPPPHGSWSCRVLAVAEAADGRRCHLEVCPVAPLPDRARLGEGELATVVVRDAASGHLLGRGECHMSLRFFLHQFSGEPLP
jgi:hypothetical protein